MHVLGTENFSSLSLSATVLLCFLAIVAHYFLGKIFIGGGLFLRILAGLVFSSAVTSIAVSFYAGIAKYLIYIMTLFPIAYECYRKCHYRKSYFDYNKIINKTKPLFIFLCLFSLLVAVYFSSISRSDGIFNGHNNYFSGISLELLRADYYSRLRIFDNYPLEWGKYHFFNGSLTALPQIFLSWNDFGTYMLAKIGIISVLLATIIELSIKSIYKKYYFFAFGIAVIYVFTMLPHQLYWSISTNAYSSIAIFLIFLQLLDNKRNGPALFFLFCFGLSTSRSLLPAFLLACVLIWNRLGVNFGDLKRFSVLELFVEAHKTIEVNFSLFFACLVVFVANLVMILSGQSVSSPYALKISNLYNQSWFALMSPSITYADIFMRNSEIGFLKPNPWWHLFWLAFLSLTVFWKINKSIPYFSSQGADKYFLNTKIIKIIGIVTTSFLVFFAALVFYPIKFVILYYFLPVMLAIYLSPANLRPYVTVFTLISILQIYLLKGEISIPNYAIIEWVVLLGLLKSISSASIENLMQTQFLIFGAFLLVFLIGLPLNPFRLFDLNPLDSATKDLRGIGYISMRDDKMTPICFQGSDADAALAAASGHRVYYSDMKSDRYSISMHFGVPNQDDLDMISRSCR
jgi:hypothetical protein